MPGWLGKQASCYVGANSQFFLFFLFYHQKKIAGRIEIRSFVRNKVAIGRTCGWIESYALKFFKSGFMDKPSAKRRRGRTAGQPKTVRAQFQYLRKHGIEKKAGHVMGCREEVTRVHESKREQSVGMEQRG